MRLRQVFMVIIMFFFYTFFNNSLNDLNRKASKSTRYPLEVFSKPESTIHHANTIGTINGYRIKSAQQLSKQKPSGI